MKCRGVPLKTLPPLTPPYKGGEKFPVGMAGMVVVKPDPSLQRRRKSFRLPPADAIRWTSPCLTKEGERKSLPFVRGIWEIELVAGVTVRPYDLPFVRGEKVPMCGRPLLNSPSLLPFVRGGKVG